MDLVIEQTKTQNLANLFLLPFIKRSASDFRGGKFVNSYLDIENVQLVIEVEDMQELYKSFEHYSCTVNKGYKSYIFYDVPVEFHGDLAMFMDGKYSRFSPTAKKYIRKYSRLPYRQGVNGEVKKSVWYHVLEKSDKLRVSLERKFDCDFLDSAELASKPTDNNFFHNI